MIKGRGQQDASKALRMLGAATRTVALRSNDGEINYSSLSIKTAGRKSAVTA